MNNFNQNEIEIENLSYQYPKGIQPALENITLQGQKNKFIAVMGKTGAGKTTLLSTMNGLIPQFSEGELVGTINIRGQDTRNLPIQRQIEQVGLVLQDPETQIFGLTVEKDIAFGPVNLAYSVDRINKNVQKAAELVGLQDYLNKSPEHLSGGEKQRLAIAGILALDSPILVFDEPTAELDPEGANKVYEAIRSLVDLENRTVIFSSHNPYFVLDIADELWILNNGKLVYTGDASNFFKQNLATDFDGLQMPEIVDLFSILRQVNIYKKDSIPLSLIHGENEIRNILIEKSIDSVAKYPASISTPTLYNKKVVELFSISYRYADGFEALKEVSTSFYSNEITAIVGKNGAGKTTLVKQLNGLLKPSEGKILLDDVDIRKFAIEELSQKVGYVFQNPDHQIFSASVFEEIEYGLLNIGMEEALRKERIKEALELTGLTGKEDIHPFNLSKGERQKLAIASVLALKPKLIIVDEPTTGLDWEGSIKIMNEIRELKKNGHSLIIITHNIRLVAEYAERVIIMNAGKIIRDGNVHEVLPDIRLLEENSLTATQVSKLVFSLKDLGFPQNIINVEEFTDFMQNIG